MSDRLILDELMAAARSGDTATLRRIADSGFDLGTPYLSKNALMVAVEEGHLEFVKLVLKYAVVSPGGDSVTELYDLIGQTNSRGENAFAIARRVSEDNGGGDNKYEGCIKAMKDALPCM